jgi:hypothetical protein
MLGIATQPDHDQQEDAQHSVCSRSETPGSRQPDRPPVAPLGADEPMSAMRTIGMFQSSRSSTVVTPRPA